MKEEFKNTNEWMDRYLTGKLSEEEKEKFEEFLFNCDDSFFKEFQFREKFNTLIKKEGKILFESYLKKKRKTNYNNLLNIFHNLTNNFKERPLRYAFIYAAISLFIVLLIIIPFKLNIQENDDTFITSLKDTLKVVTVEKKLDSIEVINRQENKITEKKIKTEKKLLQDRIKLYAANFQPSPDLEGIIGEQRRSHSILIISPQNSDTLKNNILFKWDLQKKYNLYLKILNNKEDVLFNNRLIKNEFLFKKELSPGLYYWKLESEDKLLYVGKFFIKVECHEDTNLPAAGGDTKKQLIFKCLET